ncbi:MAG: Cof-type HAD-IIB family hydrolase [Eubacterium sp.]|nr:Cof-type HAD-IIB family hydrolase [Clostridiales bacterium]MDY3773780.1 Cof-type HAD-IIB family hydrolase [Eubacterium sp.]
MKQKILFFDIDGTLIDEETDQVPESAKVALAKAKEKGHLLFLCSGRCLAIIPKDVMDLGFDGLIGGCGTYIEMNGKEWYHHVLPEKLQKEIIRDLQKYHIDGVLEGKDCSAFRHDYWMPKVASIFTENGSFSARTQCFWEDDFSFDKMALWFDESSDMAGFRKKYETQFDFIERDPTFYEVVPKGISKATGIEKVCKELKIDREDTIGFGDSANDVSMLACVNTSVAMRSGNPILFDRVTLVTDGVMQDGIANAIHKLGLL